MTTLASSTTNVKPTRPNPPETWPAWTDRDRWSIAPDANPAATLAAPCPAVPPTMGDDEFRAWKRSQIIAIPADVWSLGLASTHLLTALTLNRIEGGEGEGDAVAAVWGSTEPGFRAEALGYIRAFVPGSTFAGWIARCLSGSPLAPPCPDDDSPYAPTDAEAAEVAGWNDDGDDAAPCPEPELDWASMFADFDPHDPAERVEILGHHAYA